MGRTRRLLNFLPRNRAGDYAWNVLYYVAKTGRWPHLRRPRSFTEHLFALRFSGELRSPLRRLVSDKVMMKDFVRERAGPEHCVPTVAVLSTAQELDAFAFPDRCVIKPAHMSGQVLIRNGDTLDREALKRWLSSNYDGRLREPNYDGLPRRIIVEPPVFGMDKPPEFKVHCFAGEPKFIAADSGRVQGRPRSSRRYTPCWQPLTMRYVTLGLAPIRPPPANLELMLRVCRAVSKPFGYMRVDLYSDGERVLVGELTNLPAAGLRLPVYSPRQADLAMGEFFRDPSAEPLRVLRRFLAESESAREPEGRRDVRRGVLRDHAAQEAPLV